MKREGKHIFKNGFFAPFKKIFFLFATFFPQNIFPPISNENFGIYT